MSPLPPDEDRRLAALRASGLLDSDPEERLDRVTRLARRLFDVPVALVSLIDAERQWFISCQGLEMRETSRAVSFCTHALFCDEVMVVPDALADERFRASPLVAGPLGVRFYAGKVVREPGGERLGTICLWDFQPREWSAEDSAALGDLAILVEEYLVARWRDAQDLLRLYEHTVMQTSEPIAITRPDPSPFAAEILFANPAFCSLFGYSAEELIGARWGDFPNPLRSPDFVARLEVDLPAGYPCRGEGERRLRDGTEIFVEWRVAPIRNREGVISFLVWMVIDLTEHRRRERSLAEARDAAESSSRAKSEFLANMSHELKTPLNTILGFSEILAEGSFGPLNAKQEAYVANIQEGGRQLLAMISDLLDLAKIEAERLSLAMAEVDVGALLHDLGRRYAPVAERRGLSLSVEAEEEMPAVRADPRRLEQVLHNLLGNALKFTAAGGWVTVRAGCRREAPGAPRIRIAVADSGIGIRAEDQERLFHAFEQVDGSSSRRHPGSGLGLALARRIVELHGGRIWLESAGEGTGTVFTLEIPLKSGLAGGEGGTA
jgi:PAS domain S-box-containing protein